MAGYEVAQVGLPTLRSPLRIFWMVTAAISVPYADSRARTLSDDEVGGCRGDPEVADCVAVGQGELPAVSLPRLVYLRPVSCLCLYKGLRIQPCGPGPGEAGMSRYECSFVLPDVEMPGRAGRAVVSAGTHHSFARKADR